MYIYESITRVRYGETDRMGYVYHGRYAEYFEIGRTELIRNLGLSYRELEDLGILMPVVFMNIKFIKPAYYDEELKIRTIIKELPTSKIIFNYEIYNSNNELITTGETHLVFINKVTNKIMRTPIILLNIIKKYWE